mmetsp:Transcript_68580/g.182998  ORF Transcript_68580/g.182998 Transcript_68580/m.182998 type:complete len:235 (+) Transcript_68580:1782-2486(+)
MSPIPADEYPYQVDEVPDGPATVDNTETPDSRLRGIVITQMESVPPTTTSIESPLPSSSPIVEADRPKLVAAELTAETRRVFPVSAPDTAPWEVRRDVQQRSTSPAPNRQLRGTGVVVGAAEVVRRGVVVTGAAGRAVVRTAEVDRAREVVAGIVVSWGVVDSMPSPPPPSPPPPPLAVVVWLTALGDVMAGAGVVVVVVVVLALVGAGVVVVSGELKVKAAPEPAGIWSRGFR